MMINLYSTLVLGRNNDELGRVRLECEPRQVSDYFNEESMGAIPEILFGYLSAAELYMCSFVCKSFRGTAMYHLVRESTILGLCDSPTYKRYIMPVELARAGLWGEAVGLFVANGSACVPEDWVPLMLQVFKGRDAMLFEECLFRMGPRVVHEAITEHFRYQPCVLDISRIQSLDLLRVVWDIIGDDMMTSIFILAKAARDMLLEAYKIAESRHLLPRKYITRIITHAHTVKRIDIIELFRKYGNEDSYSSLDQYIRATINNCAEWGDAQNNPALDRLVKGARRGWIFLPDWAFFILDTCSTDVFEALISKGLLKKKDIVCLDFAPHLQHMDLFTQYFREASANIRETLIADYWRTYRTFTPYFSTFEPYLTRENLLEQIEKYSSYPNLSIVEVCLPLYFFLEKLGIDVSKYDIYLYEPRYLREWNSADVSRVGAVGNVSIAYLMDRFSNISWSNYVEAHDAGFVITKNYNGGYELQKFGFTGREICNIFEALLVRNAIHIEGVPCELIPCLLWSIVRPDDINVLCFLYRERYDVLLKYISRKDDWKRFPRGDTSILLKAMCEEVDFAPTYSRRADNVRKIQRFLPCASGTEFDQFNRRWIRVFVKDFDTPILYYPDGFEHLAFS